MWFVFPQVAGLGQSPTSRKYAITSLAEAEAYLRHPVLGPRLVESAKAVAAHAGLSAVRIFGGTDAQKLRSSMTLFLRAAPEEPVFQEVLDRYFDGSPDPRPTGCWSRQKGGRPLSGTATFSVLTARVLRELTPSGTTGN